MKPRKYPDAIDDYGGYACDGCKFAKDFHMLSEDTEMLWEDLVKANGKVDKLQAQVKELKDKSDLKSVKEAAKLAEKMKADLAHVKELIAKYGEIEKGLKSFAAGIDKDIRSAERLEKALDGEAMMVDSEEVLT